MAVLDDLISAILNGDTSHISGKSKESVLRLLKDTFRSHLMPWLLEQIPAPVIITNTHNKIVGVNKTLLDHMGYTRSELLGQNPSILRADMPTNGASPKTSDASDDQAGSSVERLNSDLWSSITDGNIWTGEFRNRSKSGQERWYAASVRQFQIAGYTIGYIAVMNEITSRVRAEEALKQSEHRYHHLFHDSPSPLYLTDTSGRFIDFNKALLDLFGYSRHELLAMNAASLYADSADRTSLLDALGKKGKIEDYEVQLKKKDGSVMICKITAIKEHGVAKNLETNDFYLGYIRDITLKRQLDQLKLQEAKSAAFKHLVLGLRHDLNNLLASVIGHSTILSGKLGRSPPLTTSQIVDYLGRILSSAHAATDVVARLDSDELVDKGKFEVCSLDSIIADAVVQFSEPQRYKVIYNNKNGNALIICDRVSISRVIQNLLKNAKDAMANGGNIELNLNEFEVSGAGYSCAPFIRNMPAGKYYSIHVSDQGIGIAPEDLTRIFDPYFSTKPLESGRARGLGLASVRGIVAAHKGYISVASQLGKGTTFRIYLPVPLSQDIEEFTKISLLDNPSHAGDEAIGGSVSGATAPLHILAVDDEVFMGELLPGVFEERGYRCTYVSSSEQALSTYTPETQGNYDLILLDVNMPHISGLELYRTFSGINPNIKVLFASGHASVDYIKQELGRLSCPPPTPLVLLIKPFDADTLFRNIDFLLSYGKH